MKSARAARNATTGDYTPASAGDTRAGKILPHRHKVFFRGSGHGYPTKSARLRAGAKTQTIRPGAALGVDAPSIGAARSLPVWYALHTASIRLHSGSGTTTTPKLYASRS